MVQMPLAMSETKPKVVEDFPIAKIRRDGGTQGRAKMSPATVDRYAGDMDNGDQFPAVKLFHDPEGNHWLADGFHTTAAQEKRNKTTIKAEIREGTLRDAILYSAGANAGHGLQRTNDDKRNDVLKLLNDQEWFKRSDNWIAKQAKVSQPYVGDLRKELTSKNVLSGGPAPDTKRIGRDGVVRETSKIGRQPRASSVISDEEADIDVESDSPEPAGHASSKDDGSKKTSPAPAAKPTDLDPEGWTEQQLKITIIVNPGKSARRGILISGRTGEDTPVFNNEFTAADLEPYPPAMEALINQLKAAFRKSESRKKTAAKRTKARKK